MVNDVDIMALFAAQGARIEALETLSGNKNRNNGPVCLGC